MTKKMTRREMLSMGTFAGAAAVGLGTASVTMPAKAASMEYPFPYKRLSKNGAAKRAYASYFTKGGCMIAVFDGIIGSLVDKLGAPYTDFPMPMMKYGAGGVALWGTLCGTLNGAAAAVALIVADVPTQRKIISEIYASYEASELPVFKPKKPVKVDASYKMAKANPASTLCHASISAWIAESGEGAFTGARAERCGRLCADVAKFTATLLNKWLKGAYGAPAARPVQSEQAAYCLACHHQSGGEDLPNEPQVLSNMQCTTCHTDHTGKYPDSGLD